MKKLIFILILFIYTIVNAEVIYNSETELFTMDPIINSDDQSNAARTFYVMTSTTGFIYFSVSNVDGRQAYCTSDTPIGMSRLDRPVEIIAQAPRWLSWKVDCNTVIGDGDGEILYITSTNNTNIYPESYAWVIKTRNNPNPIIKSTMDYNGVEFDVYTIPPIEGEIYRSPPTGKFVCVIASNSEHAKMLKKLKFDDIQIGIKYFLAKNSKVILIPSINTCGYGRISITVRELEV